jgi:2-amino-4-hydroxy-6-hydroxymethyldihydropteridine diphosphokinase/dihydropteroate synthase
MVILGLGSNLGDRAIHLQRAISRLSRGRGAVLHAVSSSRIYESPALTPAGAPGAWDLPYLNCALSGETTLEPDALLRHIQEIERSLGRQHHERWAPRVIDIDILWWDGTEVQSDDLTIPHPEILRRPFVLEPLRDLIPDAILGGETIEAHALSMRQQVSAGEIGATSSAHGAAPQPGAAHEAGEHLLTAVPSAEADFAVHYPTLMGILNVTPNSFSDGGRFMESDAALQHARRLVEEGAGIIDVGAESTRPDGTTVDQEIEWAQLEPVLRGLREIQEEPQPSGLRDPFLISLDSRNPATVRSALEIGVDILNDVTGFSHPEMLEIAEETDLPLVFMHSLSIPVVKGESIPRDRDSMDFLIAWAEERLAEFDRRGIARHRLVFDPGIGFGKTIRQSWHILEHVERFHDLALPILVGHSRKSFLQAVTDEPSACRDPETLDVSKGLISKGVEILRVHDVKRHAALFHRHQTERQPQSANAPH